MGVGSGLGASIGTGIETTWGTYATPTRFPEFLDETLQWKPKRSSGKGLYNGGLVERNSQRQTTSSTIDGDLKMNIFYKGMGHLLGASHGSLTTVPVQQAATAAYLQTHNLQNNLGRALSIQVGRPDLTGTIQRYSYTGCKVTQAVFECGIDELLTGTFSFDGKAVDRTVNPYTTPVYQSANPTFAFEQAQVKIGTLGAEALLDGVRKVTLTYKIPNRVDRFYQNGTGLKSEQIQNGQVDIAGVLEMDYVSDQVEQLFEQDTAQSFLWSFTGPIIASSFAYNVTFAIPNIKWDSEPPKVSGPDVIQPKIAFSGTFDDTNIASKILYTTTDTVL